MAAKRVDKEITFTAADVQKSDLDKIIERLALIHKRTA